MGVLLVTFLIGGLVTLISYWWYKDKLQREKLAWIPRVPGLPIIGNIMEFTDSTVFVPILLEHASKNDGLCYIDLFNRKLIVATNYDFLQFVLTSMNILDKSFEYKFFHKWLGMGLLNAREQRWKKSRKMLTPAFHFSILEQFVDIFDNNSSIMCELLQKEAIDSESVLNIFPYVAMSTLDIICESAMRVPIGAQKNHRSDYVFAVKDMCRIVVERVFSPIKMFDTLYPLTKDYYKEKRNLEIIHSRTLSVIRQRKKELEKEAVEGRGDYGGKKKMAFLDLLLQSTIDGRPLTEEEIRAEVDTFMFEGHDTTSAAISFTLYCLSEHEDVQRKAIEEQHRIFGKDKDRSVTHRELLDMKYLELVIKESLRIYPSVPFVGRLSDKDVKYKDGKIIPAGVGVLILISCVNLDPKIFPDPHKFDPSRFEHPDKIPPYSYLPFSAGSRNCIGQKFAILEMKAVISKVLRNFVLLPAGEAPIICAETILNSKNGVKVRLGKREWI
uniref:Cytochrome P450 n=1 Tax=Phaedon brassicae TaxID=154011 RepID=A0A9Y1PN10_9CUCU|nr:cytochrome P450 [Phaedon brassicae]